MTHVFLDIGCAALKGIPSKGDGKVCCAKICGKCGGKGCKKRPGGAKNCCVKKIKKSCEKTKKAPCRNPPSSKLEKTYCSNHFTGHNYP